MTRIAPVRTRIAAVRWGVAALALLAAGCAGAPRRSATVLPRRVPDLARIHNAVPHREPLSPQGNPPAYEVDHHVYHVLSSAVGFVQTGIASWYGTEGLRQRTADGERYNMFAMTAAHKTLPIPSFVRVTNLRNGRSVVVRINDRGPFVPGRIIDLSYAAAAKLGMLRTGTAPVRIVALTPWARSPPPLQAALPLSSPAASAAEAGLSVVPPMSDLDPAPRPARAARVLFVQVGAFAITADAWRTARRLRADGIRQVFTMAPGAHERLQRVRIGPLASRRQSEALIRRLARLGFPGAVLVQK